MVSSLIHSFSGPSPQSQRVLCFQFHLTRNSLTWTIWQTLFKALGKHSNSFVPLITQWSKCYYLFSLLWGGNGFIESVTNLTKVTRKVSWDVREWAQALWLRSGARPTAASHRSIEGGAPSPSGHGHRCEPRDHWPTCTKHTGIKQSAGYFLRSHILKPTFKSRYFCNSRNATVNKFLFWGFPLFGILKFDQKVISSSHIMKLTCTALPLFKLKLSQTCI